MSFILDALKKSEERRRQAGAPLEVRRRRIHLERADGSRWLFGLLAALVPLALVGGWLLRDVSVPQSPSDSAVEVVATPGEAPTQEQPIRQVASQPAAIMPAPAAPVPAPVDPAASLPRQESNRREPVTFENTALTPRVENAPALKKANELPLYIDLSPELRARLPRLDMSMHFYARSPERRLVRIDDRLLRQGDWITDDLQLVEVTPRGAILDLRGLMFTLRGSGG